MAIQKNLILAFLVFYSITIIYLFLFLYVPVVSQYILSTRASLISALEEPSYYWWALLIAFIICFLGSASIGYPFPFPIVLFMLSNSIIFKFLNRGFLFNKILENPQFWAEILILSLVGGMGSALGEISGYLMGFGGKKIIEGTSSNLFLNLDGFGKLILNHQRKIPLYVFLFALTPLPDDLLFIPLGLIKYPFWKCVIPGWLGKSFTILFYCCWPIFIYLGFQLEVLIMDDTSSIILEALLILITLTVMFFIMAFNWNEYIKEHEKKKI
ncbi:MAG: hypothetical protein ACTSYC_11780 [Promethearchaeota archaeon]